MKKKYFFSSCLLLFVLAWCEKEESYTKADPAINRFELARTVARTMELPTLARSKALGRQSAKANANSVAVYMAAYITSGDSHEMGNVVFFQNNGNKQLAGDFVPAFAALTDGTSDISYYVDQNQPSLDLSVASSTAAKTVLWVYGTVLIVRKLGSSKFHLMRAPRDSFRPYLAMREGWIM